ncbi:VOC family protein [Streptomyces sp. NPDC001795]|uniref:VOC family protein n=1 Tax=Streptomyces sp. NPDC001795 TaxID=3154525 RepID=UPI00331B72DB
MSTPDVTAQRSSRIEVNRALPAPLFHHVGVQTADLETSQAWYAEFFQARTSWTLTRFSELTLSRLPGITRLVEMVCGPLRFHLFERPGSGTGTLDDGATQYQHLCLEVDSPETLRQWRARWLEVSRSGRYSFRSEDGPTEVVVDSDGVQSFYCLDPNGLEFEFTYVPGP